MRERKSCARQYLQKIRLKRNAEDQSRAYNLELSKIRPDVSETVEEHHRKKPCQNQSAWCLKIPKDEHLFRFQKQSCPALPRKIAPPPIWAKNPSRSDVGDSSPLKK